MAYLVVEGPAGLVNIVPNHLRRMGQRVLVGVPIGASPSVQMTNIDGGSWALLLESSEAQAMLDRGQMGLAQGSVAAANGRAVA